MINPNLPAERQTAPAIKSYKQALAQACYDTFPVFFRGTRTSKRVLRNINANSDLYLYFYFHGLSLLNPRGAMCFITSNAWLDTDYGAVLQEFLAERVWMHFVMDTRRKKVFSQAQINTVIILLSAPCSDEATPLPATARFCMFDVPFEEVLSPVIWSELHATEGLRRTPEYRLAAVRQSDLLAAGASAAPLSDRAQNGLTHLATGCLSKDDGRYNGSKWGAHYLRAPDVSLELMELLLDGRLLPLNQVAGVALGTMTGANDFFYLTPLSTDGDICLCRTSNGTELEIEARYLRPVLRGVEKVDRLWLSSDAIDRVVFYCNEERSRLRGTLALRYIEAGERQEVVVKQGRDKGKTVLGYHSLKFFASRRVWYSVGDVQPSDLVCLKAVGDAHRLGILDDEALFDQRLYGLRALERDRRWAVVVACLSHIWVLFRELYGRVALGGGALDLSTGDMRRTLVPNPHLLPDEDTCLALLRNIGDRPWASTPDELEMADRIEIDNVCLSALGLAPCIRDALREGVMALMGARLDKARS